MTIKRKNDRGKNYQQLELILETGNEKLFHVILVSISFNPEELAIV